MTRKTKEARVLNKKLIAYYRTGGKYDTPLDTLDVQKRRVAAWVKKNGYEIVDTVHEKGDGNNQLPALLEVAYFMKGHVIVASGCRIAKSVEGFLRIYQSPLTPLFTTESLVDPKSISSGAAKTMGLVEAMIFGQQEYYNNLCEEWVV